MDIYYITDKQQLKKFLDADRAYHAYALADLDDPFFEQCDWIATKDKGQISTLVLIFKGLDIPALLSMGHSDHLPHLLNKAKLPSSVMFVTKKSHIPHILNHYQSEYIDPMLRMVLRPANFRPTTMTKVICLNKSHQKALTNLYEGVHGNAFSPYQLEQGVFYGLLKKGELIAVAGTHIVSAQYGVAAVGNVYTQPHERGLGYAQQLTTAVCQNLLAKNLDVVLNVETKNAPAIHIYKKLGFTEHCPFWEGVGTMN